MGGSKLFNGSVKSGNVFSSFWLTKSTKGNLLCSENLDSWLRTQVDIMRNDILLLHQKFPVLDMVVEEKEQKYLQNSADM